MSLDGKVAVVTGASRGLGSAIAEGLEAAGARVVRVARTAAYPCDVRQPTEVDRLRQRIEREMGAPQILVNAAGVFGPIEPLTRSDPVRWIETVSVDLIGPYLTCRAFVGGMVTAGWGRVVNLTSASSLHPPGPLGSAYATSKAGLNHLTRHLAAELVGTGVTANVIHPGDVKTEMWADIRDQAIGLGREGDDLRQWVDWVAETGGDPPAKAVDLVLRVIDSDVNGAFLWIDDPLQPPTASWEAPDARRPWQQR